MFIQEGMFIPDSRVLIKFTRNFYVHKVLQTLKLWEKACHDSCNQTRHGS